MRRGARWAWLKQQMVACIKRRVDDLPLLMVFGDCFQGPSQVNPYYTTCIMYYSTYHTCFGQAEQNRCFDLANMCVAAGGCVCYSPTSCVPGRWDYRYYSPLPNLSYYWCAGLGFVQVACDNLLIPDSVYSIRPVEPTTGVIGPDVRGALLFPLNMLVYTPPINYSITQW